MKKPPPRSLAPAGDPPQLLFAQQPPAPAPIAPPATARPPVAPPPLPALATPPPLPRRRNFLGGAVRWTFGAVLSALGAVTLMLTLAVVATIPIVQFISLGYLLDVSGRIAKTGRLRSGFIGVRQAGWVGLFAFGMFLVWLPLRFASSLAANAHIIAPGSQVSRAWAGGVWIGLAVASGLLGLAFFLVQTFRPGTYASLRDGVWRLVTELAPRYFRLGLQGFIGGLVWLAPPITLIAFGSLVPNATTGAALFAVAALRIIGSAFLILVVMYLPFLQTRMAAENRLRAMFEPGVIRDRFRRAGGLLARRQRDVALRLAALPAENRSRAARRRLAAKSGVRGLHLPRSAGCRLGLCPQLAPRRPQALVLPRVWPARHGAGGGVLRLDRFLHTVHWLARRLGPL